MGRALLSAFLHDLSDLVSQLKSPRMKPDGYKVMVELMAKLLTLDALVDDAEQKQFTEGGGKAQDVKRWLNELQHAVYRLEDLLLQIMTTKKSLRLRGRQFFGVFSKTKKPDKKDIESGILDTIESLEALVKKKDVLGLTASDTRMESLQGLPESSAVLNSYFYGNYPKDCFYGRVEEGKSILESLLSTGESEHIKLINIVGKAGAGKTAFAEVIYFNHKVRESFEPIAWVTVPHNATVNIIAKNIIKAITFYSGYGDDFDELRKSLQEELAGKRFLLVLDDIEDELHDLSMLIDSLESAAAKGSAIILTSRPRLHVRPDSHIVNLDSPSVENSWSIFLVHASGQMDLREHPELAAVGKKIVNKLRHLPLAAKMIGSLLQDKLHLDQWEEILRSKLLHAGSILLDAGDVILGLSIASFLVLCYLDLPAQIKRCFAYLSLFPKGYAFEQKEVVLLWMAQGFLKNYDSESESNGKSMEDIGDEYFGCLIMRSFLQPDGSGSTVSFIMHNRVHDLAVYVFGESYKNHLSGSSDNPKSFLFRHGEPLRTILPVYSRFERPPEHFYLKLTMKMWNPEVIRVLSLSCCDINDLPAPIGRTSNLCYLDLSYTTLQKLPDCICDLLNLQTLMLTECFSLTSLPKGICKLINLRYLDVSGSCVQEMPLKMHKLTSLRTLTDFIVSKTRPKLGDLAGLSNLKTLTISELQNVAYAKDVSDAKLIEKKNLDDLILQWGIGNDRNENEIEVLENLEPHKDLKRLTVDNYSGVRFPNWLGDPSYWALRFVALRDCENCNSLPTLGLLPFLKDLSIEGLTKVSSIGLEFYGEMTASQKPFQSLESLQFWYMFEWKEWNILEGIEFPRLIKLYINWCPKLVGDLPKQLLSLKRLEIIGCSNLVAPLPKLSNTCEVFVHKSNGILMKKSHSQTSLHGVAASEEVQEITPQPYSSFPGTSTKSEIEEIPHEAWMETESIGSRFPRDSSSSDTTRTSKLKETSSGMLSHQVEADIPNIKQQTGTQSSMARADAPITTQAAVLPLTNTPISTAPAKVETSSSEDLDDQRSSFQVLKVSTVSQLKSLPSKLHSLKIEGCESLEALPDDLLGGITTLKELYLISCSSLGSFSYPGSLATLYIRNCRRLEFLPSLESRKQLASLHHLFIGSSCDSLNTLPLNLLSEVKILCIWDCPNLRSLYVTSEFRGDLASLESLEIRDCQRLWSFPDEGLHTPNLASIFLSNCKNLNNLPNAMNTLTSLKSLFLHRCPEIASLPFGGLPSSLTSLSIAYCDKLSPQKDWGLDSLECLNHFELEGGCMGMESFPEEKLLPCNINSLRISTLKSLKKLDYGGFQHLNALQTLEIHCCDVLWSLPDQGLPSSLNHLCVQECPLLTPRLQPKTGKEWHKVARIPHIQIDQQVLSSGWQCLS